MIFSYFSMKTYVEGIHLKCFCKALLMSSHNICFCEMRNTCNVYLVASLILSSLTLSVSGMLIRVNSIFNNTESLQFINDYKHFSSISFDLGNKSDSQLSVG